ncbi:MAG: peptidoglycan DD-metalloendopeptidase family protein [Candidatus Nomurabacteria bacterium]|nr:peptidoglycan DD-metalloendopeptidase family protein [Candidatus Nomurabacteria bacterium]
MIFQNFQNKTFGYLNLDTESLDWYKEKNINIDDKNILLDPYICQEFIDYLHKKYSLDFSYGGWMEDRTHFLKDSYLENGDKFIHLGIDINVPTNTEVATDFKAEVVKVGDDFEVDAGWGPHVILKHLSQPIYIIYGHLDRNILCKVGDILDKDIIFAKVGFPPQNGNWFPHVHVQCISSLYYEEIKSDIDKLDGYGFKNEMELNAKRHPDPMEFISLK